MRKLVTICAVVALCAPLTVQAQGRGRGPDGARIERGDDHEKEKGKSRGKKQKQKGDSDQDSDSDRANGGRHDNGRHLGGERGRGHAKGRGRGHDNHDHDVARRDSGSRCVDADRDGRCDFRADSSWTPVRVPPLPPLPSPSTTPSAPRTERTRTSRRPMPEMVPVTMIEQKRATRDQQQWLGAASVSGRYVDADRNGVPERITWLDQAGLPKQVWRDDDRNGRANSVALYERGRLTHMIRE